MAQCIDYAIFPGSREETLLPTLNKVLGHVRRASPSQRDFREWLKEAGLWSKDDQPALFRIADLSVGPDGLVRSGSWAQQLLDASDENKARELLFKRLFDENALLVKYVFEALDTDGGGRLHSTYELHRMLTSYVYPGKHITLVPFQNWIRWAVASGRIKLIGIRWGLTELGKAAVPRLRTLDADEFLEDEAAEAAAQSGDGGHPVEGSGGGSGTGPGTGSGAGSGSGTRAGSATAPSQTASPAARATASESDEALDLPPEPEPIDERIAEQWASQLLTDTPEPATPSKARKAAKSATAVTAPEPAPAAVPAPATTRQAGRSAAPTVVDAAPRDPAAVLAALRAYGIAYDLGGGSTLAAWGIEPRLAAQEPARFLFLAALAARLWQADPAGGAAALLRERAGGSWGPAALLAERPDAVLDLLARWRLHGLDAAERAARDAVVGTALAYKLAADAKGWPAALAAATDDTALVRALLDGPLLGAPATAAFWLIRELVRAQIWRQQAAVSVAAVPTREVRLQSYRLRLLPSHHADGLDELVGIARRLASLLPAGSAEAAALEARAPTDHLRFDCAHVPACSTTCSTLP